MPGITGIITHPRLAGIEFDVSVSETHKSTAKVTDHPVEVGANISDHIVDEPDELSMSLLISNTPIVTKGSQEALALDPLRANRAYYDLLAIKKAREPIDAITSLREYRGMAITEMSCARDAKTGNVIALSVNLRQIRTATSETFEAPVPKIPRGSASIADGNRPTSPAPAAVEARSSFIMNNGGRSVVTFAIGG